MKTIAFFSNKGGVGKTSLVYHLSWMMAERGIPVLAVDLDPQANLSAMFLSEERLEEIWPDSEEHPCTIYGAVRPILRGVGDISPPLVERITDNLSLLPGDLGLSRFEDKLSDAWPRCHNSDEAAFRTMTAFHRLIQDVASESRAQLTLIDVGPNLGAINRSALIASDQVCLPLAPDLFSLQGLKNLGPTLRHWRAAWNDLRSKAPDNLSLPTGAMTPVGYIIMQHGMRDSRPVKAYQRWMDKIPAIYRSAVLNEALVDEMPTVLQDPDLLAHLKHFRSLMPLAMEANKPMFSLKPADGAIGAHVNAVNDCHRDFLKLATKLAASAGVALN
jgi:chromosome partitioning protein